MIGARASGARAPRGGYAIGDASDPAVADAVPTLFRKHYGETYSIRWLYDGAAIRARAASGAIDGFAVMRGAAALGFFDFRFMPDGAEALEVGVIIVDPELDEVPRGQVAGLLLDEALARVTRHVHERGTRLVFSTETTDHTAIQRWLYRIGMVPTGLLFATVPAGSHILRGTHYDTGLRGVGAVSRARQAHRRCEVLSAYAVKPLIAPYATSLPERYRELLTLIYARHDLPVRFEPVQPARGETRIVLQENRERGIAVVDALHLGADGVAVLADALDRQVAIGVPAIRALIPLDQGDATPTIDALVARGCVFGGLLPRYKGSDRLVLQRASDYDPLLTEAQLTDEIPRAILRHVRSTVPG